METKTKDSGRPGNANGTKKQLLLSLRLVDSSNPRSIACLKAFIAINKSKMLLLNASIAKTEMDSIANHFRDKMDLFRPENGYIYGPEMDLFDLFN